MLLQIVLVGLIIIFSLIYIIGNSNQRYWKRRGIKFHQENKLFGPFWDLMVQKYSVFEAFGILYNEYKNEPAVGIGSIFNPSLLLINPKNVHAMLQTDFNSFSHRGIESFEDQLSDNVTFMNGPRWKLMRQSITPMFTGIKLKNMFYIMNKSSEDFIEYLKNNPKLWEGGCFNTLMKFCNAAVCSTIFGITTQSIFDSPFVKVAEDFSKPSVIRNLKFSIMVMSPKLAKILRLKMFHDHEDFFIDAITRCVKQREQENVKRHDFIDTCLSIQKNGIMRDSTTGCEMEPTYGLMSAQAYFFFIAGVEPCASAIFAVLVLLGRHPEILEKAQKEVDETFEKHSQITYEVVSELEYLDKVLSEALRIFPPIGTLARKCVKDTVLPVGNIKVDKETKVFASSYYIHHDPDLYPEPHLFDPERFSKDRKPSDEIYMPFGRGNRMCIGARYSKLQILASLVHVLRNFNLKSKQDGDEVKFKIDPFSVRPINLDVQFIPRNI